MINLLFPMPETATWRGVEKKYWRAYAGRVPVTVEAAFSSADSLLWLFVTAEIETKPDSHHRTAFLDWWRGMEKAFRDAFGFKASGTFASGKCALMQGATAREAWERLKGGKA